MAEGVGKVQLTNKDLRENFIVAAKMIAAANGVNLKDVDLNQLVQGYVMSPIDARTNQAVLQFPITDVDLGSVIGAPLMPLQRIVSRVDSFCAGKLGYYLMFYNFGTQGQSQPLYGGMDMSPITFVDPYKLKLGNFYGICMDPGCIIFWHANISIEVNGIKLFKAWECYQHYYAPPRQSTPTLQAAQSPFTVGTDNAFAVTATGQLPFWQPNSVSQMDMGIDTFYPMEPLAVFSGSKQSIVNLNLPANIPTVIRPFTLNIPSLGITYGTQFILKVVLHLRGVLAQNSTSNK